jgi:hypothetical protein
MPSSESKPNKHARQLNSGRIASGGQSKSKTKQKTSRKAKQKARQKTKEKKSGNNGKNA